MIGSSPTSRDLTGTRACVLPHPRPRPRTRASFVVGGLVLLYVVYSLRDDSSVLTLEHLRRVRVCSGHRISFFC